jgi:hypothetical protein
VATVLAALLVSGTTVACSRTREEVGHRSPEQQQLEAMAGVASATVEVRDAESEDRGRDIRVDFEPDAGSQATLDVVRQVRKIATADGAPLFDLALRQSENVEEDGNTIYWSEEHIGPNVEVEGELGVRIIGRTGSTSVQIGSSCGGTLQITARGWDGDDATTPTGLERYAQIAELCDELWIDEAWIAAETDVTLSGTEPNAFTPEDFTAIEEVRALPFLAGIQVGGSDEGMSLVIFPSRTPTATTSPSPQPTWPICLLSSNVQECSTTASAGHLMPC